MDAKQKKKAAESHAQRILKLKQDRTITARPSPMRTWKTAARR